MSAKRKTTELKTSAFSYTKDRRVVKTVGLFLFILLNQLQEKNVAVFEINHAEF